jgi:hypothetical protein
MRIYYQLNKAGAQREFHNFDILYWEFERQALLHAIKVF